MARPRLRRVARNRLPARETVRAAIETLYEHDLAVIARAYPGKKPSDVVRPIIARACNLAWEKREALYRAHEIADPTRWL